jgi:hypothetical protein
LKIEAIFGFFIGSSSEWCCNFWCNENCVLWNC